jgi:hypothetical protein
MTQDISLRAYGVSKCFGCQDCLLCGAVCVYEMCSCEIDQAPPRKQKKNGSVKAAQKRAFTTPPTSKSCITSPTQVEFLKSCNEHFGYGIEFTFSFDLYFCSTCNSRYQQSRNKSIIPFQPSRSEPMASLSQTSSQTPLQTSSQTSQPLQASHDHHSFELDENSSFQFECPQSDDLVQEASSFMSVDDEHLNSPVPFNLQLLVKKVDGVSLPIKWIKFSASDFSSFEHQIEENVRNLPALNCKGTKCLLSYKPSNARILATSLADNNDYSQPLSIVPSSIVTPYENSVYSHICL